jgi:S-adenosylmethionine:tRNA ribosyltransferase-isomerase
MHISEFNYELPPELIAQQPLGERDRSRMLVVDRAAGRWRDSSFAELPSLVGPGDVVVINNTRVFPARLVGHRVTGGRRGAKVEALLARRVSENEWEAMAKPGRALPVGARLEFGGGRLRGEVTAVLDGGRRRIRFEPEEDFDRVVDEIGNTPLPPYIRRGRGEEERVFEERYQTVFARERGAIAAPTAGLHFTARVLDELRARGVSIAEITLHVGAGTFQPVRVENVEEHRMEFESYEVSEQAAEAINAARAAGGRVVAVGTTTVRTLESVADSEGAVRAARGATDLFIRPGYRFRAIDALITNFHLPQSSLIMLVAAFAGRELILEAYRHAVAERYRFYSYGDCMFIR